MRPLRVSTVRSSGPLFCSGFPVRGCRGGGESRLRGVGAELDGGLVGGPSEVGQQVADLLLTGVDDLTGGRLVDRGGHVATELLEAPAHLLRQGVRRHGGFRRHRLLREGKANRSCAQLRSCALLSAYALPEDLP